MPPLNIRNVSLVKTAVKPFLVSLRSPTRSLTLHSFSRKLAYPRLPLPKTRSVASTVSHKPGSQTLPHAAQNIKEETGNSAADLAKAIAGHIPISEGMAAQHGFLGITSIIAGKVPRHILLMGLAGSLPYLATSMASIYLARQAGMVASGLLTTIDPAVALALLADSLNLQVTYGAVLLSFTAALHWGMEISQYHGSKGYPRLFLGALPVVYAWSTLALEPMQALVAQWVGFTVLWYVDMKATSAGWTPNWYSQYRFYLSILVGTCIIGTLTATSYFGPTPGHDAVSHRLNMIRHHRRRTRGDYAGVTDGDIEAVPAGEAADAYISVRKKPEEVPENETAEKDKKEEEETSQAE